MTKYTTMALLIAGLVLPAISQAQSLPACANQDSDTDGDGFGWENSRSCRVTERSGGAPEYTNLVTSESVTLTRVYWSASRDIEERNIQCEGFFFDTAQSSYVPVPSWALGNVQQRFTTDVKLYHDRISAQDPKLGYIELTGRRSLIDSYPTWTLNDGIYSGLAAIGGAYLEKIQRSGVAAVRQWQSDDTYTECFDAEGAAFTPTGVQGETPPTYQPGPDSVVITDFVNRIPGDEALTVTNLATNEAVFLERVYWDIQKDLVGKAVYCQDWEWNQRTSEYDFYSNYYGDTHYFLHPSPTSPNKYPVITGWYENSEGSTLTVNDGVVSGSRAVMSRYVERISASPNYQPGIRIWESDQKYRQCRLEGEFASSQQLGNRFNVKEVNYGLNPGTTPPTTGTLCVDPDGDGWGWNGTSSCRVVPVVTQQCIDPDGDGWGWNGTSSCRVEPVITRQCDDPDGDGWGWNGTSSCRVEPTVSQQCIDADGDGWGWNGTASCRV